MPVKPKKPCAVIGCPNLIRIGERYCQAHRYLQRDTRPSAAKRGYGGGWPALRKKYLAANRWCAKCGEHATDVHHIQPLSAGGTNEWDNLMPLCHRCHSRVTATENTRVAGHRDYIEPNIG